VNKSLFDEAMSRFECQVCGTCCQGEGGIYLAEAEIDRIADFLNVSREIFLEKYCLAKNGRIYIHVREEDGYCHFAVEGKCTIHPVKPSPCRAWPFFQPMLTDQADWEVARNSCPALAPFKNLEDYLKGIRSGDKKDEHRTSSIERPTSN
jgi:Fe-S-cluster containining protein